MLIRSQSVKTEPFFYKKKVWLFIFMILSCAFGVFYLKDSIKSSISNNILLRTHFKSIGIAGSGRDVSIGYLLKSLVTNISDSFGSKIVIDDFILDIKFKDFMVLNQSRQDAIQNGKLNKGHFDYVKSKIKVDGKKLNAEVRLKGWYLDHVATDKWSLRVKIKDDNLLGIKYFSLNGPFTRDFHTPMLINEAMRLKSILAPREKFYNLMINGKNIGNMYFEEEYSEQFTENAKRPYGPILKFDEKSNIISFLDDESFWANDSNLQLIASKMDRILEDPFSYKHLLNLDAWAEYLAVTFLFKCWHGNLDGNLSYYFHPLERSLQPISSDNSCGQVDLSRPFGVLPYQNEFLHRLISIPSFRQLLSIKIKWWVKSEEAKLFLARLREKEIILRRTLASESPFLGKYIISVNHLPRILDWLNSSTFNSQNVVIPLDIVKKSQSSQKATVAQLLPDIFPAVVLMRTNDSFDVRINNYSKQRYVVEKLVLKSKLVTSFIDLNKGTTETSNSFNRVYRDHFLNSEIKVNFIYRDLNQPLISKTSKVNYSYGESDSLDFKNSNLAKILKYFKLDPRSKTFSSDNNEILDISETLIIPEDYSLLLSSGTKITFGSGVGLVVKGSFQVEGGKGQVVSLSGRGNAEWGGVLVIPNQQPVEINYLLMDGGSGVINGLYHRGAFTVNNAHVSINNSIFQNNNSEDALNLVQVIGVLDGVTIQNTHSDGLDVDYGDIELTNSRFLNIGIASGADAVDVSKTKIMINNIQINNVTDKGVSIGEGSTAIIKNGNISNALVGLVAKDSSNLSVDFMRLSNIRLADTMAYRKKSHFNGAKILASDVVGGVGKSFAQKGSSISFNGSDVKAVKVDIGDLYGSIMKSIKK